MTSTLAALAARHAPRGPASLVLAHRAGDGEVTLETPLGDCLPATGTGAALRLDDLARHRAGLPRVPLAYLRRHGIFNFTDPYEGSTVEELLADLATVRIRAGAFTTRTSAPR